jgi:MFS family permease
MRMSSLEGVLAMPLVYICLPGNLVLAALLSNGLGLAPDDYGWIVSLPYWCNCAQLALMPFIMSRFSARQVFLALLWANSVCWLAFAAVLGLHGDWVKEHALPVAGWFVFGGSLTVAVAGVAWTMWMHAWVPPRIRGTFFSQRNRLCQLSNFVFLLAAGWLLTNPTPAAFAVVIGGAALIRMASAVAAHMTPAAGDPPARTGISLAAQWRELKAAQPFLRSVLFGAAWGFVMNGFGTFQPVFMLQSLSDSPRSASLPLSLSLLFGALALPAWGRLVDRHGARPVLMCAVGFWAIAGLPWIFVTRESSWLLYIAWALAGTANAGIALGQLNLLMKLVPPAAKSLAVGINTASVALGMAVAPILAGKLLAWALGHSWPVDAVFHGFFLTLPLFATGAVLFLRRVQEPQAAPVEHVVGALRNFRVLAATLGLGFLAQTLFTPRGEGRKSEY